MNKYSIRVYVATGWSMLTQADHYEDFIFETPESLETFAKRLAREGFLAADGRKWIMPGAILEISGIE